MKKTTILLLCSLCLLFSCSEDHENILNDVNVENSDSSFETKSAGDEKYDLLGYGYNITKPYLSVDAVSKYQIIDVEKLIATEPSNLVYFDKGAYSTIKTRVMSGEDYFSYIHTVVTKTNFSASVASNGISAGLTGGLFSADLKAAKEESVAVSYSSAYSYATAEIYSCNRKFIVDADLAIIQKYLHPFFKQELEKVNNATQAYDLVQKYGTHAMLQFTKGGIFKCEFRGLVSEEGSTNTRKQSAEAGAKYGLTDIGLGANVGWEQTTSTEIKEKNVQWFGEITASGGSTNGLSISISSTQGTSYTQNLGAWMSSITDKNSEIVDLEWNKTYPIHMLIADDAKATLIKDAINKYITSNRVLNREIFYPLYRYWSNNTQESYLTNKYEPKSGFHFDKLIGYSSSRGYGLAGQYSVLSQYVHRSQNTYYVSTDFSKNISNDYNKINRTSLGCILTSDPVINDRHKVTPLYRYRNKKRNTYYISDSTSDPRMDSNWTSEGIIGYVAKE